MIKSFGLNADLCQTKQITAFPESDGNCSTYDKVLKDKDSFERFFSELNTATGQHLKSLPFTLCVCLCVFLLYNQVPSHLDPPLLLVFGSHLL